MTSAERSPVSGAASNPPSGMRGVDRRTGLASLLAALAAHVRAGRDQFALRSEFEGRLRELLRLKAVRLREEPTEYGRLPAPADAPPDRVCLDVPTRENGSRVLLEARCNPGALDDWSFQVLGMAAHLASLLVDTAERGPAASHAARSALAAITRPLVGCSTIMRDLRDRIARVAATDFTVLIEGESGTGKELVARQLHALSRRRYGSFVAVNCAAIVDTLLEAELFGIEERTATGVRGRRGKFEHADGGTLFLDEVADLTPAAQAKLLRAIQELSVERVGGHTHRRVDTRIVVATNRSLRQLVTRGLFREDLFYRLSGVELLVPPLRARREDIQALAEHFLAHHSSARALTLGSEALQALTTHDWPGNVRELERALEGAVTAARGPVIGLEDLPPSVRHDFAEIVWPSLSRGDTLRAWGRRYAQLVLEKCDGNKRRACGVLDISYHTLQGYLREGCATADEREADLAVDGAEPRAPEERPLAREPVAAS